MCAFNCLFECTLINLRLIKLWASVYKFCKPPTCYQSLKNYYCRRRKRKLFYKLGLEIKFAILRLLQICTIVSIVLTWHLTLSWRKHRTIIRFQRLKYESEGSRSSSTKLENSSYVKESYQHVIITTIVSIFLASTTLHTTESYLIFFSRE